MATRKEAFIQDAMVKSQQIIEIKDFVRKLEKQYFDNGYDSAGADPIVDTDLDVYDASFTAAQFGDYMNVITQLANLFFNEVVTQGDHAKSLNVVDHISL